ncbi:hypothetical protein ACIA71_33000 [Streptomyces anulatus]
MHRGNPLTVFAACTAARIGEISGCRVGDIDTTHEEIRPSSPSASCPPAPIRTPAYSRAREADVSRRIAGHGSPTTTRRYLHPDVHKLTVAGASLSAHLNVPRAPRSLPSPIAMTR